jgi:hypothetical protein
VYTTPVNVVWLELGMVIDDVSDVGGVIGAWCRKIVPAASCFLKKAKSSAVCMSWVVCGGDEGGVLSFLGEFSTLQMLLPIFQFCRSLRKILLCHSFSSVVHSIFCCLLLLSVDELQFGGSSAAEC